MGAVRVHLSTSSAAAPGDRDGTGRSQRGCEPEEQRHSLDHIPKTEQLLTIVFCLIVFIILDF